MKNLDAMSVLLSLLMGSAAYGCSPPAPCSPALQVFGPDGGIDLLTWPKSFNFGWACPGSAVLATFTLEAFGPMSVDSHPVCGSVRSILVNPSDVTTDSPEFKVGGLPMGPFFVPATFTVTFNPSSAGIKTGGVTIKSAGSTNSPVAIGLMGIGQDGAPQPMMDTTCPIHSPPPLTPCGTLHIDAPPVVFGSSRSETLTVFNNGGCPPFEMDAVTLAYDGGAFSDGGGPFILPTLVVPQSIGASNPYGIEVTYTPQSPGAVDTADLVISTTNGLGGDAGALVVHLVGMAQ